MTASCTFIIYFEQHSSLTCLHTTPALWLYPRRVSFGVSLISWNTFSYTVHTETGYKYIPGYMSYTHYPYSILTPVAVICSYLSVETGNTIDDPSDLMLYSSTVQGYIYTLSLAARVATPILLPPVPHSSLSSCALAQNGAGAKSSGLNKFQTWPISTTHMCLNCAVCQNTWDCTTSASVMRLTFEFIPSHVNTGLKRIHTFVNIKPRLSKLKWVPHHNI